MKICFLKKGFTILEILIVLAITGFLLAIVLPSFQTIRENQVLKSTVLDVVSVLEKTKSQTLSSLDFSEYGVQFETDKIIVFKGQVFTPEDPNNENIFLPSGISISLISLTEGVFNIYWDKLSGSPNRTGSITISSISSSKRVTISATGIISVN